MWGLDDIVVVQLQWRTELAAMWYKLTFDNNILRWIYRISIIFCVSILPLPWASNKHLHSSTFGWPFPSFLRDGRDPRTRPIVSALLNTLFSHLYYVFFAFSRILLCMFSITFRHIVTSNSSHTWWTFSADSCAPFDGSEHWPRHPFVRHQIFQQKTKKYFSINSSSTDRGKTWVGSLSHKNNFHATSKSRDINIQSHFIS